MKKLFGIFSTLGVLVLMAVLALSSIAPAQGQVESVSLLSTLHGITRAAQGGSGTMLLQNGDNYVFLWNIGDGWAFTMVNAATQKASAQLLGSISKGNLANAKDMGDVVGFLQARGFQVISPEDLPPVITTALGSASSWLAQLSQSMISIVVFPPGVQVPQEILKQRS